MSRVTPSSRPNYPHCAIAMLVVLASCSHPLRDKEGGGMKQMPGPSVRLAATAVTYFGSDHQCSRPATIDQSTAGQATPEWRIIVSEGVRPGSARYQMLNRKMYERVRRAVQSAARSAGVDLVVRDGDIADDRSLTVEDLTQAVIRVIRADRA